MYKYVQLNPISMLSFSLYVSFLGIITMALPITSFKGLISPKLTYQTA